VVLYRLVYDQWTDLGARNITYTRVVHQQQNKACCDRSFPKRIRDTQVLSID